MSPLALRIGAGALALLAIIALRGKRWAYLAFVLLGVLYFPAQTQFQVHVPKCDQLLPTMPQLVPLLQNYAYIALFAAFYWMSWVQFEGSNMRTVWALVATLLGVFLIPGNFAFVEMLGRKSKHGGAKPPAPESAKPAAGEAH